MKLPLYILIILLLLIPSIFLVGLGRQYMQKEDREFLSKIEQAQKQSSRQTKEALLSEIDNFLAANLRFLENMNWEQNPSKQLNIFFKAHKNIMEVFAVKDRSLLVDPTGAISLFWQAEPFEPDKFAQEISTIRAAERQEIIEKNYAAAIAEYQKIFINILEPVLRARLLNCIARSYLKAGNYQKAVDHYQLILLQYHQHPNWDGIPIAIAAYRQMHFIYESSNNFLALKKNLLALYQDIVSEKITLKPSFYKKQLQWLHQMAKQYDLNTATAYKKISSREVTKARLERKRKYFQRHYLKKLNQLIQPQLLYFTSEKAHQLTVITRYNGTKFLICRLDFKAWLDQSFGPLLEKIAPKENIYLAIKDQYGKSVPWSFPAKKYPTDRSGNHWKTELNWQYKGLAFDFQMEPGNLPAIRSQQEKRHRFYRVIFLIFVGYVLLAIIFSVKILLREFELLRLKSEFVEHISHELKTPLTSLRMYSEILEDEDNLDPNKRREFVGILRKETERLSDLIKKVLDFTKNRKRKFIFSLTPLDLNKHVTEAIAVFQRQKNNYDFKIQYIAPEEKIWVKADQYTLQQVWANLLENAVKYSQTKKELHIHLLDFKKYAAVEIIDFGIGMSKIEIKKVFEKYYRIRDERLYSREGVGLGLAIVKKILKDHKARIDIKSEQKKGTRVKITFKKCRFKNGGRDV
ncbi:HAMP domain-containing histidine kinase [bacterium]|nr:HAMP domain-containing histidine kinase [bacterium]